MKKLIAIITFAVALAGAQTMQNIQDAMEQHRQKIDQAIADRDYDAWKAEHEAFRGTDDRFDGKITADNFDKFAQMVEARKAGDMATVQKLRTELGVDARGLGNGNGKGQGKAWRKGGNPNSAAGTGTGMQQRKGKGKKNR